MNCVANSSVWELGLLFCGLSGLQAPIQPNTNAVGTGRRLWKDSVWTEGARGGTRPPLRFDRHPDRVPYCLTQCCRTTWKVEAWRVVAAIMFGWFFRRLISMAGARQRDQIHFPDRFIQFVINTLAPGSRFAPITRFCINTHRLERTSDQERRWRR